MLDDLLSKRRSVAVIGLGYVGLPLALAFGRAYRVIGYDIDPDKVRALRAGYDPNHEITGTDFESADIQFTTAEDDLAAASFYVVAVPTPVDAHRVPDLDPLRAASRTIARHLHPGDYVVYESTVYPGCTEDDCVPLLEAGSGLRNGADFKVGYSPERINPGDRERALHDIQKIVSAGDAEALEVVAGVYERVIRAGIYRAPSIRVAEAAKVVENTQRDINISFVNELAIICDKLNLDTQEVLDAAATKWNFVRLDPGLVGGHCISVDPYYLLHKAKQVGYDPQVILSGRRINDSMPTFLAKKLVQLLLKSGKILRDSKVLVLGCTFKENVRDIRNSKVFDLIAELRSYHLRVAVSDPHADSAAVERLCGSALIKPRFGAYDAVVVAVGHAAYADLDAAYFTDLCRPPAILMDVKGRYQRAAMRGLEYWRL